MALRSPTQAHNDWGIFAPGGTPSDNLPNVAGSPTQNAALQVGDTATVSDVPVSKWYCIDATLGAAVWSQLSAGSVASDITPYRITVGCAAAPYNDTSTICDFLDPGDGSGIAAAIAAANAFGPTLDPSGLNEFRVEVFIRAGQYDFRNVGSPSLPLVLSRGVSVMGASSASVSLIDAEATNQTLFAKEGRGRISGMNIFVPTPVGAPSGGKGVIQINATNGSGLDSRPCIVEDVTINMPVIDRTLTSIRSCVNLEDDPIAGIGRAFDGLVFRDCNFTIANDAVNPSGGSTDNIAALRVFEGAPLVQNNNSVITLENCKLVGGDNSVINRNVNMKATNCIFDCTAAGAVSVALRNAGAHSQFANCTVFTRGSNASAGIEVDATGRPTTSNFSFVGGQVIAFGSGTNSVGVLFLELFQSIFTGSRVSGWSVGVRCNDGVCARNVIVGNILSTNATPALVDTALNEYAHTA